MKPFEKQLNDPVWRERFPLHAAVCNREQREVETLLRHGAMVNSVDNYGTTPLLYGTRAADLAMVRVLLRAGADPNKTSSQGVLPLWIADDDFEFHEVAKLLRQYGARK
jgi:ankyrin repeat protein